MEDIAVKGLVIREVQVGEADKLITLLTPDLGRIAASVKGAFSLKSKNAASSQLLTYSSFILRKKGERYYVRESSYIENFMNIRYDLERLALANYICDIAYDIATDTEENPELVQLVLNTLYALSEKQEIPAGKIKGAFEFRLAVQEGFMPDLSCCGRCGREPGGADGGEWALDIMEGMLLCGKCMDEKRELLPEDGDLGGIYAPLPGKVTDALRYLEEAEPKKILAFSLGAKDLPAFGNVCEKYLLNHLGHGFTSLEYYRKIRNT
jgi:DNA repair protein RecO (recombination protein O)